MTLSSFAPSGTRPRLSLGAGPDAGAELSALSRASMGDASPRAALTSLVPRGDASAGDEDDASQSARADVSGVLERPCLWCGKPLKDGQLRYCQAKCRKTAWRSRQLAVVEGLGDAPKRLGFADPPYVGLARRYYGNEPTYRGEVDHANLIRRLVSGGYDGWALCCSRKSLRYVLSLVPAWVEPIPCTWIKIIHRAKARGIVNIVEHVIVVPARRRFPGVPDGLVCSVARGGDSTLIGRKPIKFVNWVFGLLGAAPVDTLDDLFPGSGIVGRCWGEFKRMGCDS